MVPWVRHCLLMRSVMQHCRQKCGNFLKNPDISINKIIDSVGYSNSTHFYKIFKKSYGVTPIDYRNNNVNFN